MLRTTLLSACGLCTLMSWTLVHGQDLEITTQTRRQYAAELCLQEAKRPDGEAIARTRGSEPAASIESQLPDVAIARRREVAPLLGPFRAGDPLSAPALPDFGTRADGAPQPAIVASSSAPGATIETSSENSRAAVVYNLLRSSGGGDLRTTRLELSSPLSKSGDAQINRLGEFASDARFQISTTRFGRAWKSRPGPTITPAQETRWRGQLIAGIKQQLQKDCPQHDTSVACTEKRAIVAKLEPGDILFDGTCMQKFLGSAAREEYFDALAAPVSSFFGGFSSSIGTIDFDYKDPATLQEKSETKMPWSTEVFFGMYSPGRANLFRVGYGYVKGFKAANDSIVCQMPDATLPPACQSGKFDGAKEDNSDVGFIEWRGTPHTRFMQAIQIKYTYDFDKKQSDVDVPVYLFKNADGKLNGGVRALWNEEEDFGIGIFVGGAFSTDF